MFVEEAAPFWSRRRTNDLVVWKEDEEAVEGVPRRGRLHPLDAEDVAENHQEDDGDDGLAAEDAMSSCSWR